MFNFYPYTDFHELNADWILAELKRISTALNDLYEQAVNDAVEQANAYTDSQLQDMRDTVEELERDFADVLSRMDEVEGDFSDLVASINDMQSYLIGYIDAQIVGVNARTDAAIAANNNNILTQLSQFLTQIKVVNFFTGEMVTIQEMFDYLCGLHLDDSIDYDEMALRSKTYTELIAINMDYTELVKHGNTLYV